MQRIPAIDQNAAGPQTAQLLAAVRQKMGGVPNLLATLAQSHAALGAISASAAPWAMACSIPVCANRSPWPWRA